MEDALDFLLTMAPPPARTRAVILGELLAARASINQVVAPSVTTGRGGTPLAEYKALAWRVTKLVNELSAFDRAAMTPAERLQDDVKTSEQELAHWLAARVDRKFDEAGRVADSIKSRRAEAIDRLAQAQTALASFERAEAPQPAELTAPAAPGLTRSPAAQARLDAHIEADRVARLKSK